MPDEFLATPNLAEPVATPAATVAVLRDGSAGLEVLLLRRNARGSFAGMWVFPGGRVDPGDGDGDEVTVARRAAAREAHEEAGLELDPARMATLSWWMPPAEAARRFATWFFLAPSAGADVLVDRSEVQEHRWMAPSLAQAARDRGEMDLAPPTWMTLDWLARRADVVSALADAAAQTPERFVTRLVQDDPGVLRATVWEGDAAFDDGDLARAGGRRRLVVDEGSWRFESSGP